MQVVGGLVAYVFPKLERKHSEIYIYDLAVLENVRRKGIATQLIRTIQRIATEIGAWVLFIQAEKENEPAIRLYSKLGRHEAVEHFDFDPSPISHPDKGKS